MIIDVPTADDFSSAGIGYLNLAWDEAMSLLVHVDEAREHWWAENSDDDSEESEEESQFWNAAQRDLGKALTLAVQGTEFLLKGKIANVSPFLLITHNVAEWPRGCNKSDVCFADFKTIDAQDLCRLHDTVATPRLTEEFVELFARIRRQRNTITHSIDPSLRLVASEILVDLLTICEHLMGKQKWFETRYEYLRTDKDGVNMWDDYRHCVLSREFGVLIDLLKPAQATRFLGVSKRKRFYRCPNCDHECADWQLEVRPAFFKGSGSKQRKLYCFVCREEFNVDRIDCRDEDCPGNVIHEGVCLTCGNDQDVQTR